MILKWEQVMLRDLLKFLPLALLLSIAFSSVTMSQVFLTIDSTEISPNGTTAVDVSVTGTGQLTNLIGYEFRITPSVSGTSQLTFEEEDESFLTATDYLFFGNSAAQTDGNASSVASVSTTVLPNDTLVGGDSTADFSDVTIDGTKSLITLRLQHDAGPANSATTIGNTFSIDLVPTNGDSVDFGNGLSNSGLLDSNFTPVGLSSNSATITVAVVIPEPNGMTALAMLALGFVSRRKR